MFEGILYVIYGIATAVAVFGFFRLSSAIRRFRRHSFLTTAEMIDDMPSVSVCIPARNEGHAMTECLERVIASTYPKLEVIVLDDKSGDKTSTLIKAFARDGVRFVEGDALRDGWLGKNQALNDLLLEASGAYVLFMDVDTRLAPDAIEQLVAYAQTEKAAMVSVLPRREDGLRLSKLFSPLRYFWELLFHRQASPAAASSAWLLDRSRFVEEYTDFSSLKDVIQPEATIASWYMQSGLYRFLIGTTMMGVSYEKRWQSQLQTSIRLLYPLLGARKRNVIVAAADLLLILGPVLSAVVSLFIGSFIHVIIGFVLYAVYAALYGLYLKHVWRTSWALGALLWPLIVLQEVFLLLFSLVRYQQGHVSWKGRPIRLPGSSQEN